MASDINQIIDPKLVSQLEKINNELIAAGTNVDKLIPSINKLNDSQKELGKTLTNDEQALKKLAASQKESEKINKQLAAAEAKLEQIKKGSYDTLLKIQQQSQKELSLRRQLVKIKNSEIGSNERLAATITVLEKKLKTVNQSTDRGKQIASRLTTQIDKLNAKLTAQSSALTKQKRNIGNYSSALQGMGARAKRVAMQFAGALGLTSAVFLFVNVLKGAFSTIRSFTKENAVLAGVLGTTRKQVGQLTDQAIQLGAVYPVTASEVTKLQVSFARLGFTQSEIINLTEATIRGSIALNSELDATATLVGAVVKAFNNLGTQDSGKIIDILTLATQRSSLSFESLETALPKVAGAANAMNISLEETTALLGIAQDATLDASISGTSLRNIFLELSKRGLTLEEALAQINSSSNRLTASYDLFGKRAAIVGLALANNTDRIQEFETELSKSGGTAKTVAEEQMNTLDGSLKSVASSWEKLILGFKSSEGFLSKFFKNLANDIDITSNKYISGFRKYYAVLGIGRKRTLKQIQFQQWALGKIQELNKDEIQSLIDKNKNYLDEDEDFKKDFLMAVEERYKAIDKATEDQIKREEIAIQQAEVEKIALEKEASEERIKQAEKETKEKIRLINEEVEERLRLQKLEQSNAKEKADLEKEWNDELDALIEEDIEKQDEIRDREIEESIKFGNEQVKIHKENSDKRKQIDQEEAENKKRLNEEIRQQAFELGNLVFDFRLSKLDAELQAAEGNEQKQAEIRTKIAKQEKAQALFNIAINTAEGIVKALPNILLSALVGAVGLAQAAIVASKPIPQFAKGTDFAPGGLALVGEKGRELIQNPRGEIMMANNPALINLERGSKVLSNRKTEAYLNDNNIVSELRQTRKAIQRIPQPIFRNGSKIAERRDKFWINYRNQKHRLN